MLKDAVDKICSPSFFGGDIALRPRVVLDKDSAVEVEFPTGYIDYVKKQLEKTGFHPAYENNEDGVAHYNYFDEDGSAIEVFIHNHHPPIKALIYKSD